MWSLSLRNLYNYTDLRVFLKFIILINSGQLFIVKYELQSLLYKKYFTGQGYLYGLHGHLFSAITISRGILERLKLDEIHYTHDFSSRYYSCVTVFLLDVERGFEFPLYKVQTSLSVYVPNRVVKTKELRR